MLVNHVGVRIIFFRWGNVDALLTFFSLLTMQCHWKFTNPFSLSQGHNLVIFLVVEGKMIVTSWCAVYPTAKHCFFKFRVVSTPIAALFFLHHKENAPCKRVTEMRFVGSSAFSSLMLLFTLYETTWLTAISSRPNCLAAMITCQKCLRSTVTCGKTPTTHGCRSVFTKKARFGLPDPRGTCTLDWKPLSQRYTVTAEQRTWLLCGVLYWQI